MLATGLNADTGWISAKAKFNAAISSRSTFNPSNTEVRVVSTDTLTTLLGNVNGSVNSVNNRVHIYNTDTTRPDLGNSIGTLAAAKLAADYWHNVAVYSDSGATGSNPWSSSQRDSLLFGRWRYSGDSSNVLLAAGDSVPAYLASGDSLKLALIKAKIDKLSLHSASPNDTDVVAYSTNATGTGPYCL